MATVSNATTLSSLGVNINPPGSSVVEKTGLLQTLRNKMVYEPGSPPEMAGSYSSWEYRATGIWAPGDPRYRADTAYFQFPRDN